MYFERNPLKSLRHKAHDAMKKVFRQRGGWAMLNWPVPIFFARPCHNLQQMIEQILHLSHEIDEPFKAG